MKKWIVWILVVAVVGAGGYYGYRFFRRRSALKAAVADIRQNVATAKVERRDLEVIVTGKGTVQANLKKNVQPGVAGSITQVLVKEGDLVKAGDSLMVLSNDSVQYQADQARLDLALAKQALDNLTGPAGSRAKAELDVKQAELNLSNAQDKVDALTVKSPISGEVWNVAVKEGDSVKTSQTIIATVADTSSFTVATKFKQSDLTKVKTGGSVSIAPGGDLRLLGGTVQSIGKEGTAGTKGVEFPVTVRVIDPGPDLRAGMTVNVNFTFDDGSGFSLAGTVSAQDRKDVKADTDGTVSGILVAEGAQVTKGQALVKLDNNSLVVALDQARNAVENARQSLASYPSQIDQQKLKVEQAQVSAGDKAETAAKLAVRSPIDGKVVTLPVQVGDDVGASQNVASVAQVSPLTVVIPVDELDVTNISAGQPAKIEVDAFPGEEFDGIVQKVAQEGAVQQGITNYNVTLQLQSDAPRLGMSATATIAIAQKQQVLTIPVEAVKWDKGQAYVNQVENGQVVQKRVKIGVQGDLYAEVASGLNEGETVLVGNIPTGTNLGGLRMPTQIPKVNVPAGGTQTRPQQSGGK